MQQTETLSAFVFAARERGLVYIGAPGGVKECVEVVHALQLLPHTVAAYPARGEALGRCALAAWGAARNALTGKTGIAWALVERGEEQDDLRVHVARALALREVLGEESQAAVRLAVIRGGLWWRNPERALRMCHEVGLTRLARVCAREILKLRPLSGLNVEMQGLVAQYDDGLRIL